MHGHMSQGPYVATGKCHGFPLQINQQDNSHIYISSIIADLFRTTIMSHAIIEEDDQHSGIAIS
jgi:hypothetical protein